MDEAEYRLEEALLFSRYGIVGYRTDEPAATIDIPGGDVDTDLHLSNPVPVE